MTRLKKKLWYLLYTKPREELKSVENLINQNFEIFFPQILFQRENSQKELIKPEPMFPRYLFVRLDLKKDNWVPIKSTLGVSHFVSFGNKFSEVPIDIITFLKARTDKKGILKQKVELLEFKEGDKLTITDVILVGQEVVFLSKKSKDRVRVLLKLVNQQISTVVPVSIVKQKTSEKSFKL